MKSSLEINKEYSEKYIQKVGVGRVPEIILPILKKSKKIVDLGCGDGGIVSSLINSFKSKEIVGIDISPRRIGSLKKKFPGRKFHCEDICKTSLKKNLFDIVISTQAIEHVEDDKELIEEIYRILKKGGYVYISSVIKKPWAMYKYRRKGKFVLDPTHEREYQSKEEFLDLFKNRFKLIKVQVYPVKRKRGITIKIPGYYIIETLWKK